MAILPLGYKIGPEYRVEDMFSQDEPVKQALAIKLGHIYTKDTNGYIIEVPHTGTTTVKCDLRRGVFYALVDSANGTGDRADSADGSRLVPFAQLSSFVLMEADAGITSGDRVSIKTQNQVGTSGQPNYVAPDVIANRLVRTPTIGSAAGGAEHLNEVVGRVWEVLTARSRTDRRSKVETAAGDIVAVRLGVF